MNHQNLGTNIFRKEGLAFCQTSEPARCDGFKYSHYNQDSFLNINLSSDPNAFSLI